LESTYLKSFSMDLISIFLDTSHNFRYKFPWSDICIKAVPLTRGLCFCLLTMSLWLTEVSNFNVVQPITSFAGSAACVVFKKAKLHSP
jgi:hypothetical protein